MYVNGSIGEGRGREVFVVCVWMPGCVAPITCPGYEATGYVASLSVECTCVLLKIINVYYLLFRITEVTAECVSVWMDSTSMKYRDYLATALSEVDSHWMEINRFLQG